MLSVSFSILSEDNLSQSSFEGIASTFHHTFQRQDHFRVGSSLVSWIFIYFTKMQIIMILHLISHLIMIVRIMRIIILMMIIVVIIIVVVREDMIVL